MDCYIPGGWMIRLEHVSKSFASRPVVADLSFELEAGGITGFLGPNGAGKTTTMRLISGFLAAEKGRIWVAGRQITDLAYKRDIGYLPENCPLYADLTVLEHLEMIGRLRALPASSLKPAIRRQVDTCGLGPYLNRPAGQLSKGCRQRVGLAAALIHDPTVLILDEPTTGLDPIQILEIRALLATLGQRATVLVSTHLLDQVAEICRRILVLDNGRLRFDGPPEQLAREAAAIEARLIVDRDPETVATLIANFPFIRDIDAETCRDGFHSYRLRGRFDDQAMSEVFQFLAQQSWRVSHWAPVAPSLESRFARLTRGDNPA